MKERTANDYTIWLVALCLALLTLVAYWQTFHHDYIAYDDEQYVTMNPYVQWGLTKDSVKWAFTTSHASNWHPLTWMSHMLDCRLFGISPVGPHAVNLLLHIANTLLLLFVLNRMTKSLWKSAFVAALFALHPMHVESVAWVSERKDVLSALFLLLTVWAYVRYSELRGVKRYLPVALLFGLGLLSKPSLVTLPFALLLLDYWPLGRFKAKVESRKSKESERSALNTQLSTSNAPSTKHQAPSTNLRKLVLEKLPLLAMAAASSASTYWAQKAGGALIVADDRLSPAIRVDNAIISYVTYIRKMFWPQDMAIFYPHPMGHIPAWQIAGGLILLVSLTVLSFRLGRRHPYLTVGWLWYLGTLVPMIGLVQVGKAAMADRYTYISYIGLFIILAWGIPDLLRKGEREKGRGGEADGSTFNVQRSTPNGNPKPETRNPKPSNTQHPTPNTHTPTPPNPYTVVLAVVSAMIVVALATGAWLQLRYWQNPMTIFSHALDVTTGNDMAHIQVGNCLFKNGKTEEAIKHYTEALRINPYADRAHNNLGNAYALLGRPDKADREYRAALAMRANPVAYYNLGNLYSRQGKLNESVAYYEKALEIQPDYPEVHTNLADVLTRLGRLDEAAEHAAEVQRLMPNSAEAHYRMAGILVQRKDFNGAMVQYREAIRLKPDYAEAHYSLGSALALQGHLDEAFEAFTDAVKLRPNYADAHFNLGVVYDTRNDEMPQAMKEYRLAIKDQPGHFEAHINLAIDLYISGKYAESWNEVKLARKYGGKPNPDFVKALSSRMREPQ